MILSTTHFASATGEGDIAVHKWTPHGKPVGVVQFVHGMSEYVLRFEPIARFFTEKGYVFCGHDLAGHGESIHNPENKGFFAEKNGWDKLIADTMQVHKLLKTEYPDLVQILYGHSMGSLIARSCAGRFGKCFDAYIWESTAGPNYALPLGKLLAQAVLKLRGSHALSKTLNTLVFGPFVASVKKRRTIFDWLSHDPEVVDKYLSDPMCGFSFRAAAYCDLFHGVGEVNCRKWALSVPNAPIYIVSGDEDPVGNFGRGVKKVVNMLLRAGKTHIAFQLYHGGRHELHNETFRSEFLKGIEAFLKSVELKSGSYVHCSEQSSQH